jgi:hypothetical protein
LLCTDSDRIRALRDKLGDTIRSETGHFGTFWATDPAPEWRSFADRNGGRKRASIYPDALRVFDKMAQRET